MKHLVKNKYWDLVEDYNLDKLLYLLIDRPYNIDYDCFLFNNNKQDHRNYDLPSCIRSDGCISWWKNNKRHRSNNKPARIWINGGKEYWVNGDPFK